MKSYFADTVQLAVEQARRELGADAALVTSRVTSADARHLGRYEVVFASDLQPESKPAVSSAPAPSMPSAPAAAAFGAAGIEELAAQLGMVRRQVELWRQASIDTMEQPRWMLGEPELQSAFAHLLAAEVDRDLAVQLLTSARKAAEAGSDLRGAIEKEIRRSFRLDPLAGARLRTDGVVALVGPPGAGKTTTLAKLAIRYGISGRRPLTLISYDAQHVGAAEELRWYASILGVAFHSVDSSFALAQAIDERRGKGLVLIDTPGFTVRDLSAAGCEQAQTLASREDVETHLVLPLSMRSRDLTRVAEAFGAFRPARLIFTRLDETDTYGPALTESARSGLPVSFFGTGQNVPEDLEPATGDVLLERLIPPAAERARKVLSAA